MTVRAASTVPPFVLEDKRAIVKSLDSRGREQIGFGDARDVWVHFALVPLAGGLTKSIDIRFVGGSYWYRVEISRQEARDLLAQEPGTEDIRKLIDARFSLEAAPKPQSRMRCQYRGAGRRCDKEAMPDWTTCAAHRSKGGPREAPEEQETP